MKAREIEKKFMNFFKSKNHAIIPSSSLIPENDPTVLFTTAGMHPLVPYLLGQKHSSGKRLVNNQICLRTDDIDEVGDSQHLTFFEMLGNWSLGDYWKKEAIEWSYEFLTKHLKLKKEKLVVSVFRGDKDAPKDKESNERWLKVGISKNKIFYFSKKENWWGPAGQTGPCGPDTEMFYWNSKEKIPKKFDPDDDKWVEVWNDVFMQYNKDKRLILVDGMYSVYDEKFNLNKELLELLNSFNTHTILTVNGFREKGGKLVKDYDQTRDSNWKAFSLEEKKINKDDPEYFKELMKRFNLIPEEIIYFDHDKKSVETANKLGILSKHYTDNRSIKKFIEKNLWTYLLLKQQNVDTGFGLERAAMLLQGKESVFETDLFMPITKKIKQLSKKSNLKSERIIADHVRASTFILAELIQPSNVEHGYILRRLLRRSIRHGKILEIKSPFLEELIKIVIENYKQHYPKLKENKEFILKNAKEEEQKFEKTLNKGLNVFNREIKNVKGKVVPGKLAFLLFTSYGFPLEITKDLAKEENMKVDEAGFNKLFKKHQELSRTAAAHKFKAGLADHSERTIKLHTATHLLHAALKKILGECVKQMGSNITQERLRFDFSHPKKLTEQEIKKVEDLINLQIKKAVDVSYEEMPYEKAVKKGALSYFRERYPKIVKVYTISKFSKEICTGPHVKNTKQLKKFKILKEKASAAGVRRIKATVD